MAENRTTSKKDLEEVVIRVDECMNGAGGIKDQLKDMDQKIDAMNVTVVTTLVSIGETKQIAIDAKEKADNNRKYIDKLNIAVIGSCGSAIIALIIALTGRQG